MNLAGASMALSVNDVVKLVVAVGIVLPGIAIANYYFNYLPHQDEIKEQTEKASRVPMIGIRTTSWPTMSAYRRRKATTQITGHQIAEFTARPLRPRIDLALRRA
jgi:hypothetical protein